MSKAFIGAIVMALCMPAALPADDAKIQADLWRALTADEGATASFFIVFPDRPDLSAAKSMPKAARAKFVVQALRETASRSQAGVVGLLRAKRVEFTPFWVENKIYVPKGDLDLARDLARLPMVVGLIPEVIYTLPPVRLAGDAGITSLEWNIGRIGADQVWSVYGNTGAGAVVANIDTGVQYTHPALVNQYRGKSGTSYVHTGNWYDPSLGSASPADANGHGTHTMGTMVGSDGGSNQIGVAPGAKWIACRGCATNSCSGFALTSCAQWVMDPRGDGTGQPDVVNNSWGGGGGDNWYVSYVRNWRSLGIFPAFSNGNSGPSCGTAGSPGDYPESFASGATTSTNAIASYSSRGPSAFGGIIKPNLSAPGSAVRSSVPTDSYASYSGTSMASPHTAASAALLWAVRPSLNGNIAMTESLLTQTAAPMTSSQICGGVSGSAVPNNTFGYGLLNVKAAVDAGGGQANLPPTVTITSPAEGTLVNCGESVTFTATASDPEDQSLTIFWQTDTQTATGPSVPFTFSCTTETGLRTVTASVTDSGGAKDSDTRTVNVQNPSLPAAPTGLTARVSGSSVTLNWTDNSGNESGFKVQRKPKISKAWAQIGTATGATYTDSNLPRGDYQYRVLAFNASGDSLPSNTVNVKIR